MAIFKLKAVRKWGKLWVEKRKAKITIMITKMVWMERIVKHQGHYKTSYRIPKIKQARYICADQVEIDHQINKYIR